MTEWQPIGTAPNSRLILAWMEGFEEHSGVTWVRNGYALIALHDGVIAPLLKEQALNRLTGPDIGTERDIWATHWVPLPEPPE